MKKLLPIGLVVLGMMVIFAGFIYEVVFAGIPYPDPTPAMLAGYNFHAQVAAMIRWGGLGFSAIGGSVMIFRRLSK